MTCSLSGKSTRLWVLVHLIPTLLTRGITEGCTSCALVQRCQAEGVNGRWNPARTHHTICLETKAAFFSGSLFVTLSLHLGMSMDRVAKEWGIYSISKNLQSTRRQRLPQVWGCPDTTGRVLLCCHYYCMLVSCWLWMAQECCWSQLEKTQAVRMNLGSDGNKSTHAWTSWRMYLFSFLHPLLLAQKC